MTTPRKPGKQAAKATTAASKAATGTRGGRPTRVAASSEPRSLTDAREMRALAHPLRVQLLEALTREGPLTATEAADLLGESPANCSFHLRNLAKYGFVEEADGGTGRARPWRRTSLGISFEMVGRDADASVAAHLLSDQTHERLYQRLRAWSSQEGAYPPEWRNAAFSCNFLTYLTPEEMNELGEELTDILRRYQDRTLDISERPEGSLPVSLVCFGHPLPANPSGN